MMALINIPHFQWAVATFYLVSGAAALLDGPKCTKCVILGLVVAFGYLLVMLQIDDTWTGEWGRYLKFVIALEAGLFLGLVAHWGWEGAQLLIGGTIGVYIYQLVDALAVTLPYVKIAAEHSLWTVIVSSLCVVVGCLLISDHPKYGLANKVLGVLGPLVGSTAVASAVGYLFMLWTTVPNVGKALKVVPPISVDDVPPVSAFWMMITLPWCSEAVGFFSATHQNLDIDGKAFNLDRLLSILFAVQLFVGGASYQVKRAKKARLVSNEGLQEPLKNSPYGM